MVYILGRELLDTMVGVAYDDTGDETRAVTLYPTAELLACEKPE